MAISFLTGQRLTADLLNTNVTAFMPLTYSKASTTTRNTTISVTNDTELANIPLGIGTWEVELVGAFTTVTTDTQGLRTRWAFTGTWTGTVPRYAIGPGPTQNANPTNATLMNTRSWTLDTEDAQYRTYVGTGAPAAFREICRSVVVTVAGNLSLQWAQFASSANNTELRAGTHFNIRKIS